MPRCQVGEGGEYQCSSEATAEVTTRCRDGHYEYWLGCTRCTAKAGSGQLVCGPCKEEGLLSASRLVDAEYFDDFDPDGGSRRE